jgi:hypothetical protein
METEEFISVLVQKRSERKSRFELELIHALDLPEFTKDRKTQTQFGYLTEVMTYESGTAKYEHYIFSGASDWRNVRISGHESEKGFIDSIKYKMRCYKGTSVILKREVNGGLLYFDKDDTVISQLAKYM